MNIELQMPFEQYFREDQPPSSNHYTAPTRNGNNDGLPVGGGLAFQLPRFIADAPALALGGGAEALLPGQYVQGLAAPTSVWRVPNQYESVHAVSGSKARG